MHTLIYFVAFSAITTATPVIDATKSGTRTNINKEYILQYYSKLNWYHSLLFCLHNGMRLATIHSKVEEDYLHQLITRSGLKNERFWTSGADLAKEGRFSWYSTGKLLEYTNFRVDQPDNFEKIEHCLEYSYDAKWNDSPCSVELYFICEKILS